MRFSPSAKPAKVNWSADFRAVKRPSNVFIRRHLPAAFQPPATSLRFLALQRLRPGRSTLSRVLPARFGPPAGFGYPLGGLLPAQPCRPCFMPAALLGLALQRLLTLAVESAFLQIRTDGWLKIRPLVRASTAIRRIPPPLGFAPQVRPSSDDGELHRHRARASPGLCLSGVCPSTGLIGPSANLRPPAWPTRGHPHAPPAARRINHRPTVSIRKSPPTEAGELACLAADADRKTPMRFLHLFMILKLKAIASGLA